MNNNIRGLVKMQLQLILFIAFIVVVLGWMSYDKQNTRLTKWIPTAAVVTSTASTDKFSKVTYEYMVDGRKFDETASFWSANYPTILRRYPKGTKLEVMRDPARPSKAVMKEEVTGETDSFKDTLAFIAKCVIGLSVAMSGIWFNVHKDGWYPGKEERGDPVRRRVGRDTTGVR